LVGITERAIEKDAKLGGSAQLHDKNSAAEIAREEVRLLIFLHATTLGSRKI
jgi:hypothetical protein